jgi:major membrane immunogen (membrane-anchored lipoprotein)
MIDKEKLKAFLIEMLDEANEVEVASGETPSAQEAINQIIDWLNEDQ